MIYLMHGTGTETSRQKARSLTDALRKKKPDALFYRITSENYSENPLSSLVLGQGLFESKYIVFCDNLFEVKDIKEEVLKSIKDVKESDNIFIFLEKSLDKKTKETLEKYSEKVQEFVKKEKSIKKAYNAFALTDALTSSDKKRFWTLLLEAKERRAAAEEIHGMIWWQMKTIKLASVSKSAQDAEISPFVFSKAQAALKIFDTKEKKNKSGNENENTHGKSKIDTMLFELVTMYHEAHRGEVDLWLEMERWGLSL